MGRIKEKLWPSVEKVLLVVLSVGAAYVSQCTLARSQGERAAEQERREWLASVREMREDLRLTETTCTERLEKFDRGATPNGGPGTLGAYIPHPDELMAADLFSAAQFRRTVDEWRKLTKAVEKAFAHVQGYAEHEPILYKRIRTVLTEPGPIVGPRFVMTKRYDRSTNIDSLLRAPPGAHHYPVYFATDPDLAWTITFEILGICSDFRQLVPAIDSLAYSGVAPS